MKFLVALVLLAVLADESLGQIVSYDQFRNAIRWNGYNRDPSQQEYSRFRDMSGPKGGINSKREAAMILAHMIHETGGLANRRETRCASNNCAGEYQTQNCDIPGKYYYGRGYLQLTWCYNYRDASNQLYGSDWMIREPDAVANDEYVAWDTAFWFWRVRVKGQAGGAISEGRFGATTRVINGGLECDGAEKNTARRRFEVYKVVLNAFGVNEAANESGCYN